MRPPDMAEDVRNEKTHTRFYAWEEQLKEIGAVPSILISIIVRGDKTTTPAVFYEGIPPHALPFILRKLARDLEAAEDLARQHKLMKGKG